MMPLAAAVCRVPKWAQIADDRVTKGRKLQSVFLMSGRLRYSERDELSQTLAQWIDYIALLVLYACILGK